MSKYLIVSIVAIVVGLGIVLYDEQDNYLNNRNLISSDKEEPINENRQKALDMIKESKILLKESKPHCSELYGCQEDENPVQTRYDSATSYQRTCINTLNQGVYKNRSLSFKMDTCNVP